MSLQPTRDSWAATMVATALFLLMGSALIMQDVLPEEWRITINSHPWASVGIVMTLVFPLVGVVIGWKHGFPRWSYPYAGFALMFSLFLAGVATPSLKLFGVAVFGREIWGWRAALPLATAVVASILLTRSVRPLLDVPQKVREDPTLLTFGLFGFMPLFVPIVLDEVYAPFIRIFTTLVMTATAFLYMRVANQRSRSGVLLAGIVLTVALARPSLILGLTVIALLASPAAIGLARDSRQGLHAR